MTSRRLYLDSSALVKLILPEAESLALTAFMGGQDRAIASEIVRVEVHRAVWRAVGDQPEVMRRVEQVLAGLHLLRLDRRLLDEAARLQPPTLRSLDAIHLASAFSLGEDLDAMLVYDNTLGEAAHRAGLPVLAPGRA